MRTDCCNAAMSTERKPEREREREKGAMGRGQTEENVWAHRNDATKKYAMRAEGGEQGWHDSALICEKLSHCTL